MRYSRYVEQPNPHRYVFTSIPCPECGTQEAITVNGPDLFQYNQGKHIQDAFPYLTPAQRERFMTGICGGCFERIFAGGDDGE